MPIIRHHVDFQYEICTRKYTTLLNKEKDKQEIQEGLIKACDVIDLIIEILRGSKDVKQAKACLVSGITEGIKFKSKQSEKDAAELNFTERQAQAILDMRLQKLIGLEIDALKGEHDTTLKKIAEYSEILGSRAVMAKVIMKDLKAIQKEYGRPRRTVIDNVADVVVEEKPIEEIDVAVLIDRFFYTKVVDMSTYERNKEAADSESKHIILCKNTDKLCLFTDTGDMHAIKVLDLPMGKFRDKGLLLDTVDKGSKLDLKNENLLLIEPMSKIISSKLLFASKAAFIKLVQGQEFDVTRKLIAATKLNDNDKLISVSLIDDTSTIVMQSEKNMFLRIDALSIPEKKKAAVGVRGMKLSAGDSLTNVYVLHEGDSCEVKVKDNTVALHRLHIGTRDTKGVKK